MKYEKIKKIILKKKIYHITLVIIKMEKKMSHPTPAAIKAALVADIAKHTLALFEELDAGKITHAQLLSKAFPPCAASFIEEAIDKACKDYDAQILEAQS
jgi:hypothetical protein